MSTRLSPSGTGSTLGGSNAPGGDGTPALLISFQLDDSAGMLAPSIHDLAIDEDRGLMGVNGELGETPGKVLLDGSELTLRSWDEVGAVVELPRSATGLVSVVLAGGQKSNAVPLTRWHSTATYTVEEAGSLSMVMTFDLTFRGDIHAPRSQPGEIVGLPGQTFNSTLGSAGTYAFSGSYVFEDSNQTVTTSWSGGGALSGDRTAAGNLNAIGTISDGHWDIGLSALVTKGNHVHSVQQLKSSGNVLVSDTDVDAIAIDTAFTGASAFAGALTGYDLTGGSKTVSLPSQFGNGLSATLTLQWGAFGAESAPGAQTEE